MEGLVQVDTKYTFCIIVTDNGIDPLAHEVLIEEKSRVTSVKTTGVTVEYCWLI